MPHFTSKISRHDAAQRLASNTIAELSGIYSLEEREHYDEGRTTTSTVRVPAKDVDIEFLIPFILVNTSLHSIDFSFSRLGLAVLPLLTTLAKRNRHFKAINFSSTDLFTALSNTNRYDIDTLRNFFRTICCEELYLSSCGITADIMNEIIDAIAFNPWLKKLDVSRNQLKNTGLILVAEKLIIPNLSNIGSIQSLKLSYNGHGNKAALFIQEAMQKNYVIKKLSITRIAVNLLKYYEIDKAISLLLKRNRAIAEFRLPWQEKLTSFPVEGFCLLTFSQYFLQGSGVKDFPSALISLVLSYLDNVGKFDSLTYQQKETIFSYAIHHERDLVLDPTEFKQYFQRYLFFEEKKDLRQPKPQPAFEPMDIEKSCCVVS